MLGMGVTPRTLFFPKGDMLFIAGGGLFSPAANKCKIIRITHQEKEKEKSFSSVVCIL